MSKKRKTRKQKESAVRRREDYTHQHVVEAPSYSIAEVQRTEAVERRPKSVLQKEIIEKDAAYLKHDMVAIATASGIIIGADILLFVLLTTGTLRLNFLGY